MSAAVRGCLASPCPPRIHLLSFCQHRQHTVQYCTPLSTNQPSSLIHTPHHTTHFTQGEGQGQAEHCATFPRPHAGSSGAVGCPCARMPDARRVECGNELFIAINSLHLHHTLSLPSSDHQICTACSPVESAQRSSSMDSSVTQLPSHTHLGPAAREMERDRGRGRGREVVGWCRMYNDSGFHTHSLTHTHTHTHSSYTQTAQGSSAEFVPRGHASSVPTVLAAAPHTPPTLVTRPPHLILLVGFLFVDSFSFSSPIHLQIQICWMWK
jgi:hypothetical protein